MTQTPQVTKSRAALIHDTFRKWVESYFDFLNTAEQRALIVTPDYKLAWQNAFKLQRLLKEQQALRFEYWFGRGDLDQVTCQSLDNIATRLDEGWTGEEEAALAKNLPLYGKIPSEITDIKSKWIPMLKDAGRTLEKDAKYSQARRALAERSKKLGARLSE
jgi:hypothetical protein